MEVSQMMFKNSKGKQQFDAATVIILVIIAVVAWNAGLLGNLKPQAQVQNGQQPADTVVKVVGAPCTQATTLTSTPLRRYTDAALTSENITIYQNGVRKGAIASGSTTTVQSGANGDVLDLYPAEESTTYYTQHAKGKIETCTGSATTGDPAFKFVQDSSPGGTPITYSDVHKVMFIADGMTITGVNDGQADSQTMTGVNIGTGENLSIGTGATGSISLQFKVDYNEGLGVIGGNILACQFPNTYDSVAPISFTVDGKNLVETDVKPSTQQYVLAQANNTVKAWKFPAIDGRLTPVVSGTMLVRAASNRDPSHGDNINCTIFDTDYYVKQVDGALVLNTENRDTNANLGGADSIYDFVIGVE